jgi:transcriptional regulator with XRE-family HTH domain
LARKPSFGKHLRDARIKRGLTVIEVAEQVGVSAVSIYLWENDRVRPRDANLSALCKVLKLALEALAGETSQQPADQAMFEMKLDDIRRIRAIQQHGWREGQAP